MERQIILKADEQYARFDEYLKKIGAKNILLVCGNSISHLRINKYFEILESRTGIKVVRFSNFKPNPLYESVVKGVEVSRRLNCDVIVAVGGGTAIDVAKCIKLYSNMNSSKNYLNQAIIPNDIKLIAIPTTAGTGSESTSFAVIYYKGEKQSVSDSSCIPSAILMDASLLNTLPLYQRKSTMLDAFCHAVESFWSVNSTEESRVLSKRAVHGILENMDAYLRNEEAGNLAMLESANIAGQAINITQTTAGHAMCYKMTSLYGIAHGHAAALCVSKLWSYMLLNINKCIDPRGLGYLANIFAEIAYAMGCDSNNGAVVKFQGILDRMELSVPSPQECDFDILKTSVNPVRLKNNPVKLNDEDIDNIYHDILCV